MIGVVARPVPVLVEADRARDARVDRVGRAAPEAGIEAGDEVLGDVAVGVVRREGAGEGVHQAAAGRRIDRELSAGLGVDVAFQLVRGDADRVGYLADGGGDVEVVRHQPEGAALGRVGGRIVLDLEVAQRGRTARRARRAVEVVGDIDRAAAAAVDQALERRDVAGPVARIVQRVGHDVVGEPQQLALAGETDGGRRGGAPVVRRLRGGIERRYRAGQRRAADVVAARLRGGCAVRHRQFHRRAELHNVGQVGDVGSLARDRELDRVVAVVAARRLGRVEDVADRGGRQSPAVLELQGDDDVAALDHGGGVGGEVEREGRAAAYRTVRDHGRRIEEVAVGVEGEGVEVDVVVDALELALQRAAQFEGHRRRHVSCALAAPPGSATLPRCGHDDCGAPAGCHGGSANRQAFSLNDPPQ